MTSFVTEFFAREPERKRDARSRYANHRPGRGLTAEPMLRRGAARDYRLRTDLPVGSARLSFGDSPTSGHGGGQIVVYVPTCSRRRLGIPLAIRYARVIVAFWS